MRKMILLTTIFIFSGIISGAIRDNLVLEKQMQTTVSGSYYDCCSFSVFAQAIETYNGYQYVAFYDRQGTVCVGRRAVQDTLWDTLHVDYTTGTDDGHNTTAIGICRGDGTIHLAFDHHNNDLRYSVSVKRLATVPDSFAWHGNLFGQVNSNPTLTSGTDISVTYPYFLSVSDGRLQLITRDQEPNGYYVDWWLFEYSPASGAWTSVGMFMTGQSVRLGPEWPYPNGYTYDKNNRLHVLWDWRLAYGVNNNSDLCYAYSDDFGRTWYGSTGILVGTVNTSPVSADSISVTVWNIPNGRGYINSCGQAVDNSGRIHVVTWHLPDAFPNTGDFWTPDVKYFHYWREIDGVWHRDELSSVPVTARPRLVFDEFDNLFLITAQTTIYGASSDSGWRDWTLLFNEKTDNGAPEGGEFHEPTIDLAGWESSGILSTVSASLKVTDINVKALNGSLLERDAVHPVISEPTIQPNPFNPSARISYYLPQKAAVTLTLYNIQGKVVRKLMSGMVSAGRHTVQVEAGWLASGIYICELNSNTTSKRLKLVLMR